METETKEYVKQDSDIKEDSERKAKQNDGTLVDAVQEMQVDADNMQVDSDGMQVEEIDEQGKDDYTYEETNEAG